MNSIIKFFVVLLIVVFMTMIPPAYVSTSITVPKINETYVKRIENSVRVAKWLGTKNKNMSEHNLKLYSRFIVDNIDEKYELLIVALSVVESRLNFKAISKKGAMGVCQIVPRYWEKELINAKIIKCQSDLYNYQKNLLATQYIFDKITKENNGGLDYKEIIRRFNPGGGKSYVKEVLSVVGELALYVRPHI